MIDGVDFYLVDLRGALIDPDQIQNLRRCGAILESRRRDETLAGILPP
ncbi:MAG: hypothetical protein WKF75_09085 [Singulisphaera sp.]